MPRPIRHRVEAHVLQEGKLLVQPGGRSADSGEHMLTSRSQGCPRELGTVAKASFWLPKMDIPNTALPPPGRALFTGMSWRDQTGRDWVLLARIEQRSESGDREPSRRPFVRVRTLGIPASTAANMWSLLPDALTALEFADDIVDEAYPVRMARSTVWIEQSERARTYASRPLYELPRDDRVDVARYLVEQEQQDRVGSGSVAGASAHHVMNNISSIAHDELFWGLALMTREQRKTAPPSFAIGMARNVPAHVMKHYNFVITAS